MPRTNIENANDIANLQAWQAMQNVHNMKVDMILETLTEQGKAFEVVVKQFQESINDSRLAMQKIQDKQDYIQKVIYVVGSVIMLFAGAVIGQFVHFKPF